MPVSAYETLAAAGLVSVVIAIGYVLAGSPKIGSATLAAALAAGFAAFTAVTIAREGVLLVWTNHTQNLWGVQVWWDLLFAVGIAVFLIAPRARAAGMNLGPWLLFVAATASIGLLAMVARLFWLEARAEA
ncbi:hypothetical protein [Qipengyuania gaetbuli]|uniref:hypothetical protein n=1 Tax=Qipengyuania gaetbuli TaxID=266952 RepID=UPI0039AF1BD8